MLLWSGELEGSFSRSKLRTPALTLAPLCPAAQWLFLQSAWRQQKLLCTWRKGSHACNLAWFFPTVSSSLIKEGNSSSKPCLSHSLKTPNNASLTKGMSHSSEQAFVLETFRKKKKRYIYIFIYSCISLKGSALRVPSNRKESCAFLEPKIWVQGAGIWAQVTIFQP